MDADVVVVGAGPTGLMLAGELGLAGVRTLLLERRSEPSDVAKAGGLAGQILQLLHYRGELNRFREASTSIGPSPVLRFPFGGLHLDFTRLGDSPMRVMLLPQPGLEGVLAERAIESGAEVRRGHEVVGLRRDDDAVTVAVRGSVSPYEVSARFLVGCDGGRSRVRDMAGIAFSGTSLPEIERLASVTVPDSVTVLDDGGLDVAGVGTIPFGYTATEHGVFACSGTAGAMGIYTAEVEATDYDDVPMTIAELAASVRPWHRLTGRTAAAHDAVRLLGQAGRHLPRRPRVPGRRRRALVPGGRSRGQRGHARRCQPRLEARRQRPRLGTARPTGHGSDADALRALFLELTADEQPLRRLGALMAGTDVGVPLPGGQPFVGAFVTDPVLNVDHENPRFAGMLRPGRALLLDLADQPDLREHAGQWGGRVDIASVTIASRAADAFLIRPDGIIAWTAPFHASSATALTGLREALSTWFGDPTP